MLDSAPLLVLAAPRAIAAQAMAQAMSHTDRFLPHGFCYLWDPALLRTHVLSDVVIGVSYVAISVTLAHLVHRARRDIPFSWVFIAFGLFIVACGFTHFMDVWTLWEPRYWLAGGVKVVTALASVTTAVALPFTVPKIRATIRDARLSGERQLAAERASAERASHALLRAVFEETTDAMFVKDRDGRYLMCNSTAARVLGGTVDEVLGRTDAELLPAEQAEATRAMDARVLHDTTTQSFEERLGHGDDLRTFLSTKGVFRDAAGGVIGTFGVARDITERVAAEGALASANRVLEDARTRAEAASRAKSEFLATMSHELRTPLNAILGYAELLALGLPGPVNDAQRGYLARIDASGRHLLALIDDVLDLSKIEAGELTVERRPASLGDVVEASLALVRPQAEAKAVALHAPDLDACRALRYMGDADRVRQILANLLSNAVKFTPDGRLDRGALCAHRRSGRAAAALDHGVGARHGHRHPAGSAGADLRAVRAGRRRAQSAARRHGPGTRHQPAARMPDGRPT